MTYTHIKKSIVVILFFFPFHSALGDNQEKDWKIFNGLGDKIFSIFGNAIDNQNKERQYILKELSKSDGKLTLKEIKELENHRFEMEVRENEEAIKILNKMNDTEKGILSGAFKLGKKIKQKANLERDEQKKKLDKKIDEIISAHEFNNIKKTKLKLRSIKWSPINNVSIDKEMTIYYNEIVEQLLLELDS